jgi:hypothetical protein
LLLVSRMALCTSGKILEETGQSQQRIAHIFLASLRCQRSNKASILAALCGRGGVPIDHDVRSSLPRFRHAYRFPGLVVPARREIYAHANESPITNSVRIRTKLERKAMSPPELFSSATVVPLATGGSLTRKPESHSVAPYPAGPPGGPFVQTAAPS